MATNSQSTVFMSYVQVDDIRKAVRDLEGKIRPLNAEPQVNLHFTESVNHSINESISQPINQSVNHAINQSISQSVNQPINQSINQLSTLGRQVRSAC